jgi:hypothetical protein
MPSAPNAAGHRAMDCHAFLAMRAARRGEAVNHRLLVGDIEMREGAADGLGMGFAGFAIDVEDRHLEPGIGQRLRARLAQARCPAGDDGCHALFQFHSCSPLYVSLAPVLSQADG